MDVHSDHLPRWLVGNPLGTDLLGPVIDHQLPRRKRCDVRGHVFDRTIASADRGVAPGRITWMAVATDRLLAAPLRAGLLGGALTGDRSGQRGEVGRRGD